MAPAGVTVAVKVKVGVAAGSIVNEELFRVTPVTFTKGGSYTVMTHVATFPPSAVVAVIVVVPAATAVTRPVAIFTVAFPGVEEVQVIPVYVAFAGYIVGINVIGPSVVAKNADLRSSPIPVTGTAVTTVTRQEAVNSPSVVVTVIVLVPAATPVTLPFEATVAIPGVDDDQVTALFMAFVGRTVATSVTPFPAPVAILAVVLFNVTPVTPMKADTVTTQIAVLPPSAV